MMNLVFHKSIHNRRKKIKIKERERTKEKEAAKKYVVLLEI
jgi:hypothetical protein